MKNIKLMADYFCYPLWHDSEDEVGNIDPSDLPISKNLFLRLSAWAEVFNATIDMNDPASAGFKNLEEEKAFRKEGGELLKELKKELGEDWEIIAHDKHVL